MALIPRCWPGQRRTRSEWAGIHEHPEHWMPSVNAMPPSIPCHRCIHNRHSLKRTRQIGASLCLHDKHEMLTQCWFHVGPASATLAQRKTGIGWMFRCVAMHCGVVSVWDDSLVPMTCHVTERIANQQMDDLLHHSTWLLDKNTKISKRK